MIIHKCCVCNYIDKEFADYIKFTNNDFETSDEDAQVGIYEDWRNKNNIKSYHSHKDTEVKDEHWLYLALFDNRRGIIRIYEPNIL